jgi:hypothetical protein
LLIEIQRYSAFNLLNWIVEIADQRAPLGVQFEVEQCSCLLLFVAYRAGLCCVVVIHICACSLYLSICGRMTDLSATFAFRVRYVANMLVALQESQDFMWHVPNRGTRKWRVWFSVEGKIESKRKNGTVGRSIIQSNS